MAHGNFTLRGYLADMREEDPRRCWPFQSIVDYHEFRLLSESPPAPTNAQINQEGSVDGSTSLAVSETQRIQNGTVVGPESSEASKRKEVGSEIPEASDAERKRRKGKEVMPADEDSDDDDMPLGEWLKRKGLKVQASNVALAKPQLADSSSGLVTIEVMLGVPEAGVQAPTLALAEPRPASLFSGLELLSSVALRPEPAAGVRGASVQAPEEPRPAVSSGRLQPLGLRSRMREPRVRTGGARVQAPEEPRPDVSSGRFRPLGLRSRMREPRVRTGGARVQAPVVAPAPAGPREREVMVCRVSRNPAEFSAEISDFFLRTL